MHKGEVYEYMDEQGGVEELDCLAQSPDLNPTQLTNVLVEEWSEILTNTPKHCGKPSQKSWS